jgi:tetratricopeptide (TPR) repeat protein
VIRHLHGRGLANATAVVVLLLAPAVPSAAAPPEAQDGNRLFAQGKYQEAEKAYLEAQSRMPNRPEISYNLGNALIKQKKYEQAVQALRQAISKGDRELQANGWYNLGNAQFDMGRFGDSAQSFVQALRLAPKDTDAKHNLELSLRKMQEQKQPQQPQEGAQPPPKQEKPEEAGQREGKGKDEPKPQGGAGEQPPAKDPGRMPADPQATRSEQPQGTFSRERALQILDAIQNQELAEQRRHLERQAGKKTGVRDW